MIFVFDHDDKVLEVYPSEIEAVSACEGIDVIESPCEFWDCEGRPLVPVFTESNKKDSSFVLSGKYYLEPRHDGELLINILDQISCVEGAPPFNSVDAVGQYLLNLGATD